ncbi:MAG: hypothetical protein ACT4P6_14585 [Gemmatimonadaceae bacterium]
MFRTVFGLGLVAIVAMFLLRLFFGIFIGFFGLLIGLAFLALKIAIIGALIYLVIRIFSPDTARRMKERWSNSRP